MNSLNSTKINSLIIKDEDSHDINTVKETNEIFFSGSIGKIEMSALKNALLEMQEHILNFNKFAMNKNNESEITPIKLYITSNGGCPNDAFAIYDLILFMKVPVHTFIMGYIYSAATILFLAGKKKYATKNSLFGIHNPQTLYKNNSLNIDELTSVTANSVALYNRLRDFYLNNTKISSELINDYINKSKHCNAQECLELNIIDEIID